MIKKIGVTITFIMTVYGVGEYLKYTKTDSDVLKHIRDEDNEVLKDIEKYIESDDFKLPDVVFEEINTTSKKSNTSNSKYGFSDNYYNYSELSEKNEERIKNKKFFLSDKSLKKLVGIDKRLTDIVFKVLEEIPLQIVQGCRSEETQNKLFKRGKSSKDGYIRKSNHQYGKAIDIRPLLGREILKHSKRKPHVINMYKGNRENDYRWNYLTGYMKAVSHSMGYKLRSGKSWRIKPLNDLRRPQSDNSLLDLNHFEIID